MNKAKTSPLICMKYFITLLMLCTSVVTYGQKNTGTKTPVGKAVWDHNDVAILFIDYQPEMFAQIKSGDPKMIELNIRAVAHLAKTFNIPTVLSTVAVTMGSNKPTIDSLRKDLNGQKELDRTSMDAWDDAPFVKAVQATGKKKLIICGLFTEICLAYAVVEAKAAGYEVMFIEDAVGGLGANAHNIAVQRMIQAGAVPNTTLALSSELFRDWKRPEAKGYYSFLPWYFRVARGLYGTTHYPVLTK